jgi:FkbM family methyltransferase
MNTIGVVRSIVRGLRLKPVAIPIFNAYTRMRPRRVCTRDGIKYALDLTELIDRAIWMHGWEPMTIAFIKKYVRPGDVVIEVGANIGAHTLLMADIVGLDGHIHAFEPTAYAQRKLRANLELNPQLASRITIRSELVSNHERATPTRQIKSSFPVTSTGSADEIVSAATIALDDETFPKVSLLKVDVDGYDYKVLEGATAILQKFEPMVLVELCEYALRAQGDSVQKLFELMSGLGYRGYHENAAAIRDADEVLRIVGDTTSINAVFLSDRRRLQ